MGYAQGLGVIGAGKGSRYSDVRRNQERDDKRARISSDRAFAAQRANAQLRRDQFNANEDRRDSAEEGQKEQGLAAQERQERAKLDYDNANQPERDQEQARLDSMNAEQPINATQLQAFADRERQLNNYASQKKIKKAIEAVNAQGNNIYSMYATGNKQSAVDAFNASNAFGINDAHALNEIVINGVTHVVPEQNGSPMRDAQGNLVIIGSSDTRIPEKSYLGFMKNIFNADYQGKGTKSDYLKAMNASSNKIKPSQLHTLMEEAIETNDEGMDVFNKEKFKSLLPDRESGVGKKSLMKKEDIGTFTLNGKHNVSEKSVKASSKKHNIPLAQSKLLLKARTKPESLHPSEAKNAIDIISGLDINRDEKEKEIGLIQEAMLRKMSKEKTDTTARKKRMFDASQAQLAKDARDLKEEQRREINRR